MAGHQRPQIVLLGASMVEFSFEPDGWGAALANLYRRKADVLLRGFSGWNTHRARAVLQKLFPRDFQLQPSLVIILFGANDAAFPIPSGKGQYIPLMEYKENLKYICSYIKGLSKTTRVILLTPPPIDEEARRASARYKYGEAAGNFLDRSNERARLYAEACKSAAEEVEVEVVDLWSAISKTEDWQSCLSDGLHFSAEGSRILLQELLSVLKNADWFPSLYFERMPSDFAEPSEFDFVHPYIDHINQLHKYKV